MTPTGARGRLQIVTTVGRRVRIDDIDEDCPIMTFHQPWAEALAMAERVLRGLKALEAYGEVIP